jgi:hypothetical protein
MEEELKAVKNSLTRVADTLERIESSRSGLASSAGIAFRLSGKISCRQKSNILKYVNYEMPAEEASSGPGMSNVFEWFEY